MCVLQYSRVRMKTIMTLGLGHYKFHNGENHFFFNTKMKGEGIRKFKLEQR